LPKPYGRTIEAGLGDEVADAAERVGVLQRDFKITPIHNAS
jgi:hypothetical protein